MNTETLTVVAVLLVIQILVVFKNITRKTCSRFFWFCDFAPILIAVGFIIGDNQFIKGIINIGLLSQIFTSVLLIYGFSTGKDIIGTKKTATYGRFYVFVELVIHILPAVLAFALTYKIVPTSGSLAYSVIISFFMLIFTVLFTAPKENTNLIYSLVEPSEKRSWSIKLPYQEYLWMAYSFIVVILPTFFIQYGIAKLFST